MAYTNGGLGPISEDFHIGMDEYEAITNRQLANNNVRDAVQPQENMSMKEENREQFCVYRNTNRLISSDSTPRQQRLSDILEAVEQCIKNDEPEEAEQLVREQYSVLETINRNEDERSKIDLAEMFFLCAKYSLECGLKEQGIRSYYKGLLEMDDSEVQYLYHIELISDYWMEILTPEVSLKDKLRICNEVRAMADERMRSSNGKMYNVPMAIYNDLCLTYLTLKQEEQRNEQIRQDKLKALLGLSQCQMQAGMHELVAKMICKPLTENEYHDSPELYEVWAKCLQCLGNYEIALKKAKLALEYSQDQDYKKTLEALVKKLIHEVKESENSNNEPIGSDNEWLENTNIHEPQTNAKKIEEKKRSYVSKPRRRPKAKIRHPMDFFGDLKKTWKDVPGKRVCRNLKSPVRVIRQEDLFSHRKRKRRRWNSAGLEVSSASDVLERIAGDVEVMHSPKDLSESDSDESNDMKTSFGHTFESEESDGNDAVTEVDTLSEMQENENEASLQPLEHDLLVNGIKLTPRSVTEIQIRNKQYHYSDTPSIETMNRLLIEDPHKYKKCILRLERAHHAVCELVIPENNLQEIEICGRQKAGKNFSGDVVVVEILKHPETKNSDSSKSLQQKKIVQNPECDKAYGKVVGRLERHKFNAIEHPVFVCELDEYEYNLMRPLCKTIPKIRIPQKHTENKFQIERYEYDAENCELTLAKLERINPAERGSFVFLVAYISWDTVYPTGVVLKIIKSDGTLTNAMKIQELLHEVPTRYSPETLESVETLINETSSNSWLDTQSRLNLSESLSVYTIDPPNCKDIDDALSIQRNDDRSFCVGVHIADVTSTVRKNDCFDKDAQARATTFYPGQGFKPYHMLPNTLSENRLSLVPGEERLALSVFLKFDRNGILLKEKIPDIKKTVIKSRKRFTYAEVQDIIMDMTKVGDISDDLKTLFHLAKKNRLRRLGDAMHALPVEIDVTLTTDSDSVLKSIEAHYLVEEFMILANEKAANFAFHHFRDCVPLRCQDAPSENDVFHLLENYPTIADIILKLQGIKPLSTKTFAVTEVSKKPNGSVIMLQKWVWDALEKAIENNNYREARKLIGMDELHPEQCVALNEWIELQQTAEYRCSGDVEKKEKRVHFSLNTSLYTSFTSPIRRYPDIIVHRLIHAALDGKPAPYKPEEVKNLCNHINEVRKRANAYQKQCAILQVSEKLRRNPFMVHGFVEGVSEKDVVICIPGMHRLPQSCRELPLHFLGVSKKPEITKDAKTNKDVLTLQWQKRLYSHQGYFLSSRVPDVKRVDPHLRTVFQDYNKWLDILKSLLADDSNLLKKVLIGKGKYGRYFSDEALRDLVPACTQTVKDVSTESSNGTITKHLTSFSMSFNSAQVIRVQFCAEPRKGIMLPVPQILDLTKSVKICLEHATDPVKYLAKYSTVRSKSHHNGYSNCTKYLKIWLPILKMEAATIAAKEDSITINDVPARFEGGGGKFTLTHEFCEERNIRFPSMSMQFILTGEDEEESTEKEQYLSSSNFVCIKCEINEESNGLAEGCPYEKKVYVAHGTIDKIKEKKKGNRTIYFTLHSSSHKLSQEIVKKKKLNVNLEIMEKPKCYSRTESIIKCLEKSTPLVNAVALGLRIPDLDRGHADLAKQIDCDIDVKGLAPNNRNQYQAISKALTNSFSLIQGPPGTGKTYTGIKLVYLFTQLNSKWKERGNDMKQVVFCGPSNKSVDLVARWLLRKLGDLAPRIVRMYGSSLEMADYPIPGRVMSSRARVHNSPDKLLKNVSLHHLIRQSGKPYAEKIRQYDREFKEVPSFMEKEQAIEYHKKVVAYEKLLRDASQEELKNYDVIFCTTAMATNPKFIRVIKDRVYQCIIDECGMCTEPECIATLIATKAKQVVLIGDHKQLRPVVKCSAAADLGLNTSLFERYADWATFLNKQYRMNPAICEFVSQQFYDNHLETGPSIAWREDCPISFWHHSQTPYIFCHVEGTEMFQTVDTDEGNERSCSNKEEAEKVTQILIRLMKMEGRDPRQINVISQYNAQCHVIREHLKMKGLTCEPNGFNINTVVASQGGEWDYVIFSTVRSLPDYKIEEKPTQGWCIQNLGFITDEHQINVALSRARKGLIIIGNKKLLRCDKVWNNLLEHYGKRGCVVDGKDFPPKAPRRSSRGKKSQLSRLNRQTSREFYRGTDMEVDH